METLAIFLLSPDDTINTHFFYLCPNSGKIYEERKEEKKEKENRESSVSYVLSFDVFHWLDRC